MPNSEPTPAAVSDPAEAAASDAAAHADGDELVWLRARVQGLERELAETHARANAAIASAQERLYWLDRWHVDLNALMRRPGASEFRQLLRALRAVLRRLRTIKRRLGR